MDNHLAYAIMIRAAEVATGNALDCIGRGFYLVRTGGEPDTVFRDRVIILIAAAMAAND